MAESEQGGEGSYIAGRLELLNDLRARRLRGDTVFEGVKIGTYIQDIEKGLSNVGAAVRDFSRRTGHVRLVEDLSDRAQDTVLDEAEERPFSSDEDVVDFEESGMPEVKLFLVED